MTKETSYEKHLHDVEKLLIFTGMFHKSEQFDFIKFILRRLAQYKKTHPRFEISQNIIDYMTTKGMFDNDKQEEKD